LFFFFFYTFHFFSDTGQQTKTKIGSKDDSCLEEIEAKFRLDPEVLEGGHL